jgi:type II secretory pathway pseudopilin PulG
MIMEADDGGTPDDQGDSRGQNVNNNPQQQQPLDSSLDVEHSLPTVAEITGRSTTEPVGRSRRRRRRLLGVLVVLGIVMLAVTVGSAVGVSISKQQEADMQQAAQQAGKGAYQAIIDSRQRYDDLVRFLIDNGLSSLLELQDETSPQHLAVTFLALMDPLRLDIPKSALSTEGYQLITRHVLCVLYFATKGDVWSDQRHFLSELPTCNWWELNLDPDTQQHYPYTGVVCNSKGIITNLILRKKFTPKT